MKLAHGAVIRRDGIQHIKGADAAGAFAIDHQPDHRLAGFILDIAGGGRGHFIQHAARHDQIRDAVS